MDAPLQAGLDAPEQSAGIKHILKSFRSAQTGTTAASRPSKHNGEDAASGSVAAATDLDDRTETTVAPADHFGSGTAPDGDPIAVHHYAREEVPASQSSRRSIGSRDAEHEDAPHKRKQPSEAVLPWMRLPVSIEPGQGVQLDVVGGLDTQLRDKLKAGTAFCLGTHLACSLVRGEAAWNSLQATT